MHLRMTPIVILLLVSVFPVPASAQDEARVGLTMGYPPSVGFIWHVADRVAVRPEFSFRRSTSESSLNAFLTELPISVGGTEADTWSFGVGVSGLSYVRRWDGLRAYVSPRFVYTRSTFSSSIPRPAILPTDTSEITSSGFSIAGSFGAQYSLGRKFGIFGEVGFEYSHQETSGLFSESTSRA